ncbi:hypothetical protein Tco_0616388, partial [Tanacetum coccineum]
MNEDKVKKDIEEIETINIELDHKVSNLIAENEHLKQTYKQLYDSIKPARIRSKEQYDKTLYKALVDAYETDKDILETYGDTVTFKRRRDDEDEDEEPSAGSNRGYKRRRAEKEPESTSAPKEKTSMSSRKSKKGLNLIKSLLARFTEDEPVDETTQHPDWFQKPTKPPTPDRDWNMTLPAKHGPVQPWISTLAR